MPPLAATVTIAIAEADAARLDTLAPHVAVASGGLVASPTRAAVARVALLRGLAALEAEAQGSAAPAPAPAPAQARPTVQPAPPPAPARPARGPTRPAPLDDATVDRMRTMRAEGASFATIADTLTAEGAKTAKGGRWFPATVQKTLARLDG